MVNIGKSFYQNLVNNSKVNPKTIGESVSSTNIVDGFLNNAGNNINSIPQSIKKPANILSQDTISDLTNLAKSETGIIPVNGSSPNVSSINDSVNNIKNGSGTGEDLLKKFSPLDNPMSSLFQPAYHFELFLDSDIPEKSGKGNHVVLAETGATGINIQDVEIDAIVGPNIRTKNSLATSITIKIIEPYGAQFPDMLYQAAVTMNIANYLKAPWQLNMRLRGYDESGNIVEVGDGWSWKLLITDLQTKVNELSSTHVIQAIPLKDNALSNNVSILQDITKINSSTTVGEAVKSMIDDINERMQNRYFGMSHPYIVYKIEDRPYPYDNMVGVKTPFDNKIVPSSPQESNQTTADDYNGQIMQAAPGDDIPSVIDRILARSETAASMLRVSREMPPIDAADTEDEVRGVSNILHMIDTQIEYGDYNYIVGDYNKTVTYIIKPYDSLRILSSIGRAKNYDKESSFPKKKAIHALERKLLQKRYDYVFTGLNTEVINFDIDVNFQWAVSVPQLQGRLFTGIPAKASDYILDAQNKNAIAEQARTVLEEKQNNFNKKFEVSGGIGDVITSNASALSSQEWSELVAAQKSYNDAKTIAGKANSNAEIQASEVNKARLKTLPKTKVYDNEDLVYERLQEDGYSGATQGSPSFLPPTIAITSNDPSRYVQTATSSDNGPVKSVYGTLLNQLYGTNDGNLINITIEIKGDPYWIGPGSDGLAFDDTDNVNKTNFLIGERMFVLRFKLPQGYSEMNGNQSLAKDYTGNSNIFTGFYAVTEVTNLFNNGKFTQKLNAVKIPGMIYEDILEGREVKAVDEIVYSNEQGNRNIYSGNMTSSGGGSGGTNVGTTKLSDRELLAATLVGEAGNQGDLGMQAVGNVIKNRVDTNYTGSTYSSVILANKQFSVWNDQSPENWVANNRNSSTYQKALNIADNVMSNSTSDITYGARHYHADYVSPAWKDDSKVTTKIGRHIFYKGIR